MTCKTKPTNQTSIRINVSDLTLDQRKKIFTDAMNQTGFTGFIEHQDKNQTYYIFTYQK
jgi:hypothetical protein